MLDKISISRFIPPKSLEEHSRIFGIKYPSEVHSLITGKPVTGEATKWDLIYPATEVAIAEVSGCSASQVNKAADTACLLYTSDAADD